MALLRYSGQPFSPGLRSIRRAQWPDRPEERFSKNRSLESGVVGSGRTFQDYAERSTAILQLGALTPRQFERIDHHRLGFA